MEVVLNKARWLVASPGFGLLVVCLAVFVDVVAYGVIFPLLPLYSDSFGLDDWGVSLLVSAFALGALPAQPWFGYLSDTSATANPACPPGGSSRKKFIMMFGLVTLGSSTLLYARAKTFGLLVLARVLQGVASACTWSAGLSSLAQIYPPERLGFGMGVVQFVNSLGALLGAPLGGWMYHIGGYEAPFYAVAFLCLIDGAGRLLLYSDPAPKGAALLLQEEGGVIPLPETHSQIEESEAEPEPTEGKKSEEGSWLLLFKIQSLGPLGAIPLNFWFIFAAQMLQGLVVEYINILLPLLLNTSFALQPGHIGTLLGIMSFGNALAAALSGYVSDRWVQKSTVLSFGLLSLSVVLPLIAYPFYMASSWNLQSAESLWSSPGAIPLTLGFLALGITLGIFPALALVGRMLEKERLTDHSGFVFGICTSFFTLGMLAGPLFASAVTSWLGIDLSEGIQDGATALGNTIPAHLALMIPPSVLTLLFSFLFMYRFRNYQEDTEVSEPEVFEDKELQSLA